MLQFNAIPFVGAMMTALLASMPITAHAPLEQADNQISPSDETRIVAHLKSGGATDQQAASILENLQKGILPQSDLPGSNPKSVRSIKSPHFDIQIKVFEDGSSKITKREIPRISGGETELASISGCTASTGSGYASLKYCLIAESGTTYDAAFRASYTTINGGPDTIDWVGEGAVKVFGGEKVGSHTLRIAQSKESGGVPARALLTWQAKLVGGVAGGTTVVTLFVGKDRAWTEVR
ncbi:MAG: hypothetical protein Q4P06_02975 [Actinomycetaceae bacterium]|nr:hypothetical protein [Actinomycetaceae bacterium]